jgi:hypothetical protein
MVVLAAGWRRYDYWQELSETIKFLKKLGIQEIVLVGPAPQWNSSLPRQLFEQFRIGKSSSVPTRIVTGLNKAIFSLDSEMGRFASRQGVRYISLCKLLCNDQGCLTRVGPLPMSLTSFDYDHLTTIGSQYVVANFPDWFFQGLGIKSSPLPTDSSRADRPPLEN